MQKSLCIKTNNDLIINYLLEEFEKSNLDDIYISKCKFKIYKNVIIHYRGTKLSTFVEYVSTVLSNIVIKFYEANILKNIINSNYFYFTNEEQNNILNVCINHLNINDLDESLLKKETIFLSFIEYFYDNKSIILDGFIKFRLNSYMKILDYIVDFSVNQFVVDREYLEFIELLKVYINSKDYVSNTIHIIYNNHESILLDEFKDVISLGSGILNAKYLSDITFSSNDYALNTLLTLLPKNIIIHLVDIEDEFINTLKLIFSDRISICTNCELCETYNLKVIPKH